MSIVFYKYILKKYKKKEVFFLFKGKKLTKKFPCKAKIMEGLETVTI